MRTPFFQAHHGVSALIAIIMVMAFMFTMSSVMVAMTRSLQITQGGAAADQAQLNALTGLELGLYKQNHTEAEFLALMQAIDPKYQSNGSVTLAAGSLVNFQVTDSLSGKGRICADKDPFIDKGGDKEKELAACKKTYYVFPFPGTGTMGTGICNPSTQSVVKDEQWYQDAWWFLQGKPYAGNISLMEQRPGNINATLEQATSEKGTTEDVVGYINKQLVTLDHPCLWNKLEPGSGAEIPLSNSEDLKALENLTEFWLRIRLPCKGGVLCNTAPTKNANDGFGERMGLAGITFKNATDRTIMWNIVAECKKGTEEKFLCHLDDANSDELKNAIGLDASIKGSLKNDGNISENTTELQHSTIDNVALTNNPVYSNAFPDMHNVALGFLNKTNKPIYVHSGDTSNPYLKFSDFLRGEGKAFGQNLIKPALQISIASNLLTGSGKSSNATVPIPYVEYQLLYRTKNMDKAIITNPTVVSSGKYGGYTINLESSLTKQVGTYGYALIGK